MMKSNNLMPICTYDDWVVSEDVSNGKLFYFPEGEEQPIEVKMSAFLKYYDTEYNSTHPATGEKITEFLGVFPSICEGELDDMSGFACFEEV